MKPQAIRPFFRLLLLLVPLSAFPVTVALDDSYPPYSFRDAEGRLQGITVDQWNLWSQKTGEPVELLGLPWNQALEAMAKGEADVLDTVFLTPDRASRWAFTAPYATIRTAVFHRDGLTGIVAPADLKGYLVGIKAGDAGADSLRAAGSTGLVEYPSYEALIDAADRGEVLVFCMDVPPAVHFLLARSLGTEFRQAFTLSEDSFHRAVRRDRPQTFILVDRGFSLITDAEAREIDRRWKGTPLTGGWETGTVAMTAGVALVVVVLLAGVVVSLRRQVVRRTGQLVGTEEKLKLSEDRARALIAALPDLLYLIDREGRILEILGTVRNTVYQNPGRFVGLSVAEAVGQEVAQQLNVKMAALDGAEEGAVATLETDLTIRGETRTFEARIVALADGRFLSIVRDISVSRRAWIDDLHRNKLESLALLAGGLAHDFNNSLGVIQGFVSLARLQLSQPDKALASLDKAVQATRRAAGLTSQLRVLAHGGEVHRTLLSVRDLAEESAAFALVGSPCTLIIEADAGPWTVEADPDQLSQVFHNLVLNAVQAMPQGGPVTLGFRRTADGRVAVTVADQGMGIPAAHVSRIFDPYFTTKTKGTGLGLSVVHAVVQRHGGTLSVESREGKGAVFTVVLPAAEGEPAAALPPADPEAPGLAGVRVLIMEDDADLRLLVTEVCASLGLVPTACRNGTEAVAAFTEAGDRPFGLVVSDLLVPGDMGGRELIARLRALPGRFRALAVTGFSVDQEGGMPVIEGFDVVVGKPFTVDELKHRIVELMKTPWETPWKTDLKN